MQKIIVLIIAAPTFVYGYLFVALALLLGFAHEPELREHGVISMVWRPWFASRWHYSTTVGRGIGLHPHSVDSARTWEHENVHVRQAEDLSALGLVLGIVATVLSGQWFLLLALWLLAPMSLAINYATSGLRHGWANAYRESEHERAAYSYTEQIR